jgi:uncharacterized membrane protein YdcZ (DUF606 family)
MHSRVYFFVGSILTFIGLVASMITSIFLVGLIRFSLRTHGPMGEYRFDKMLSSFPWWFVLVGILGFIIGILLLRKYDFSYKLNFKVLIIGFVLAIVVTGWVIDMVGLNDVIFRQNQNKGRMRTHFQTNDLQFERAQFQWKK